MRRILSKFSFLVLITAALVFTGCLISGTFVIVENATFDFTADRGFYWYPVDLTGNSVWEEHEEDIDNIDALGMQFSITNTTGVDTEFNAWFIKATGPAGDPSNPGDWPTEVPTGALKVIDGLTVAAGATRHIGYLGSLSYITNIEKLKEIIKTGRFDYYGQSTGGSGDDTYDVTNGKIVITISASST
ncbi:MAG: hypothetical protein GY841_16850 [FCB group bacterium]|nr:hypothetical protein [FCB group bacterium]